MSLVNQHGREKVNCRKMILELEMHLPISDRRERRGKQKSKSDRTSSVSSRNEHPKMKLDMKRRNGVHLLS